MHFRIRKNVIQLIRTTYDHAKKKGVSTIVGTIDVVNPVLSPALKQQLTPGETAAFEAWLMQRRRLESIKEELAALMLAENITMAKRWFEKENGSPVAQAVALELVPKWQLLRSLLTKQGLID